MKSVEWPVRPSAALIGLAKLTSTQVGAGRPCRGLEQADRHCPACVAGLAAARPPANCSRRICTDAHGATSLPAAPVGAAAAAAAAAVAQHLPLPAPCCRAQHQLTGPCHARIMWGAIAGIAAASVALALLQQTLERTGGGCGIPAAPPVPAWLAVEGRGTISRISHPILLPSCFSMLSRSG